MIATSSNEAMNLLQFDDANNKIKSTINNDIDNTTIQNSLINDARKLIFPVCGKRCFNCIMSEKNKSKGKGESECSIAQSWDNDEAPSNHQVMC